jgi:hypothetical protein
MGKIATIADELESLLRLGGIVCVAITKLFDLDVFVIAKSVGQRKTRDVWEILHTIDSNDQQGYITGDVARFVFSFGGYGVLSVDFDESFRQDCLVPGQKFVSRARRPPMIQVCFEDSHENLPAQEMNCTIAKFHTHFGGVPAEIPIGYVSSYQLWERVDG